MINTGFAREIITPERHLPLMGYLNPRFNCGVLDDLFVKVLLFDDGNTFGGIVSYDLCAVTFELINTVRQELQSQNIDVTDNLLFCCTHTHTGPYTLNSVNQNYSSEYINMLGRQTLRAFIRARANLTPSSLWYGSVKNNPYAFNRRYYMKDGSVVTNPGKMNPDIVRPEGEVDREIGIIKLTKDDMTEAIIVNICNHSDTIGGNYVSADWPGRMEKAIQQAFGYEVPVITLIGASGNINHFDVVSRKNQTCYREAERIGKGYAKILLNAMRRLQHCDGDHFELVKNTFEIIGRTIPTAELNSAKELMTVAVTKTDQALTSEDIVKGSNAIRRCFAAQLLAFHEREEGKVRNFNLLIFKFGSELAIASVPGEPFTEVGIAIKRHAGRKLTMVVAHANGKAGYLPLPECFDRGGYEILPVLSGGAPPNTAVRLQNEVCRILDICRHSLQTQ